MPDASFVAMGSTVLASGPRRGFQRALLAWYRLAGRRLRIRETRDPWHILVSEVMAQQTQIARVDEAWGEFMATFPTPTHLARASTAEVLRAWQGLGYNRRAVALQRAARTIVTDHAGRVPAELVALEALPGIGPYTARAVAALAFGLPVAAVDTNVRRVVSRLIGGEPGPRALQSIADQLVARGDPRTWTHATMELGATVCRIRRPACSVCPVQRWCASAGRVAEAARSSRPSAPRFEESSRWLRGRIVARLRELDDGEWTELRGPIGSHEGAGIEAAVAALSRDGLVERRADGWVRLPSSLP